MCQLQTAVYRIVSLKFVKVETICEIYITDVMCEKYMLCE